MTDEELVLKKLARIETCVRELRSLVRPDEILEDLRAERFAEHTLQIAIQAAQDVASHIVSSEKLGEPNTNRELFDLIGKHDWVRDPLLTTLKSMIGFRNILVHGYDTVDKAVVRDILENHLDDLLAFSHQIRERLGEI